MMPKFKCKNCGVEKPCLVEIEIEPTNCVVSQLTQATWTECKEPWQTDLEKWCESERKRIFASPEEYEPEEHEMIFTPEEIINLHQSMRP